MGRDRGAHLRECEMPSVEKIEIDRLQVVLVRVPPDAGNAPHDEGRRLMFAKMRMPLQVPQDWCDSRKSGRA